MNSYLRMASLAGALLGAAAVLVIAQPVQAATVTSNFYSNRMNDGDPGSPTFLITGSFSFAFDETRTDPNDIQFLNVTSFTMDIAGSLVMGTADVGAFVFAGSFAGNNVFSGNIGGLPGGLFGEPQIPEFDFNMTFLMSSSGDIGFPDFQPKFLVSFADGTRVSRKLYFGDPPPPAVPIPPAFLLFISAIAALGSLGWWRRALAA